jgi:hypothetical protein
VQNLLELIVLAIVWVTLGFLLAIKGKEKKIGFYKTLIISILLTPLVAIFFVMASHKKLPKRIRARKNDID